MGSNREILKTSLSRLKSHYFYNVVIVFFIAIIVSGGYNYTMLNRTNYISNNSVMLEIKHKTNFEVLDEFINKRNMYYISTTPETMQEKYSRGVFSVFVNEITGTGSFGFGILNGINKMLFGGSISEWVTIFIMALMSIIITVYVKNVLLVGKSRYFMEHRLYDDTKVGALMFPYLTGHTRHVAYVMMIRSIKQTLWNFTIIGGFYKHYEYMMIPYILAENPNVTAEQAFKMSKDLMMNDKLNMFKIDLLLLPIAMIDGFTFHLTSLFFLNPYRDCVYSEVYSRLRENKRTIIENGMMLYDDVLYRNEDGLDSYPEEKCPTEFLDRLKWLSTIDFERDYSVETSVLFFFFFSFIGWFWEVIFYMVNEGRFINRGTMCGPWLPIYGVAGIIIVVFLRGLRKNPAMMFTSSFLICGTVEYMTSWILEKCFNLKWWDYQGYFMNLNGRVCLEGLLVFGLAGVLMTYFIAPFVDNLFRKIPDKTKKVICILLIILFVFDVCYSSGHPNVGDGVTENLI